MSAPPSKSAQITALVAQLKAGQLTKAELFERLQRLQAGETVVPDAVGPQLRDEAADAMENGSRRGSNSALDASALQHTFMAYRDAARSAVAAQQSADGGPPSAASSTGDGTGLTPRQGGGDLSAGGDDAPQQSSRLQQPQRVHAGAGRASAAAPPPPPPPSSASAQGSRQRASAVPPRAAAATAKARSSLGGGGGGGGARRSSRRVPALPATIDSELAECTFTPSITPLPEAYKVLETIPFAERVRAWEDHRREEAARLAADASSREIAECTFKPAINRASRSLSSARAPAAYNPQPTHERLHTAATSASRARTPSSAAGRRRSRGGGGGGASHLQGLGGLGADEVASLSHFSFGGGGGQYDPSGSGGSMQQGGQGGGDGNGGARPGSSGPGGGTGRSVLPPSSAAMSYLSGGRPLFTSAATGSPATAPPALDPELLLQPRPLTREEEEVLKECTFQPRVNAVYDARPVRARYLDTAPRRNPSSVLPFGLEHCTFRPATNSVRASTMPAAALYVQAPIYERLARTQTAAQREREAAVAAEQAQLLQAQEANLQAQAGGAPSSPTSRGGGGGSGNQHDDPHGSGGGTAVDPRLADFLLRQAALLNRRQERIAQIAKAMEPSGRPMLCAKSLEIVAEKQQQQQRRASQDGGGGDAPNFLERVSRTAVGHEHAQLKARARLAREPECTFTPAINPVSAARPRRSVVELSRGDALKKETAQRLLKLRAEAEELEGVTFAPVINERSKQAEGRLRILVEPDNYVQRLQAENLLAQERAAQAAAEAANAELSQCTFRPAVHAAPEYISRIARSMALARAVRPPEPGASSRPDWR